MSTTKPTFGFKATHKKVQEKKKKLQRQKQSEQLENEALTVPRSIVYSKDRVGYSIDNLTESMRSTMLPFTAKDIAVNKDKRKEIIDFSHKMAVSHLIEFSQSEKATTMKICKLPRGPTVYFTVTEYCSHKDIKKGFREAKVKHSEINTNHPAVTILNNFNTTNAPHIKLAAATLQNMFPPVDLKKFNPKNAKRVVLFNYLSDESIEMRQYTIKIDGEGKKKDVSLVEVGPRMTLKVLKILEGCFTGDTIYHSYITKTPQEVQEAKVKKQKSETEKARRRQEQEENVARKKEAKESKEKKDQEKIDKIRREGQQRMEKNIDKELDEEDDDEKYYRKEVGEAPPMEYELSKKGKQQDYYTEAKKDEKKRKREGKEDKRKKQK